MALFKRRKYQPPEIGSALDPYHYPEDVKGKPAASPSLRHESVSGSEDQPELDVEHDESADRPASQDESADRPTSEDA